MKGIFTFSEKLAGFQIGHFEIQNFPIYAAEAIEEGLASPSLIVLAGLTPGGNPDEILSQAKGAMDELGIEVLSHLDASKLLIGAYMRNIILGHIDPFDGMVNIDFLYNQKQDLLPDSEYLGGNLGLEHLYTWYREIQDWEDNDNTNFYFNELPRDEQREKFLSELLGETQKFCIEHPDFPGIKGI